MSGPLVVLLASGWAFCAVEWWAARSFSRLLDRAHAGWREAIAGWREANDRNDELIELLREAVES